MNLCRCKQTVLEQNEASIGEIELKEVIYKFYLQEYGGKTQKLWVGSMNIEDNRKNSKIP